MNDKDWRKTQRFAKDFAKLVRKYMPLYPVLDAEAEVLCAMQDATSCYSPYVWSAQFGPRDKK